jgi:hypothetical protein
VRRLGVGIFAALVLVGAIAPAAFAASPSTAKAPDAVPKVVFIVGPAGAATDRYRAQARIAADIARHYTPDVIELYSPDATWPAVKEATKGASLVVYMGHGNGWPSRYRDSLFPPTQDGFGLNPAPGGDDSTHQYFGEGFVGSELKLAKNAVVLLNHLCYASGNSEPGLPEGTLAVAQQRVDNYAAGFIKAGAAAVIAEAWSSPNYFVRAILSGTSSIQSAWLHSPSANGHRIAFASQRSRGYVAQMDPETATSGFTRSIVMKSGLAPHDVLAGAAGSALSVSSGLDESSALLPPEPTLLGTGLTLSGPTLAAVPTAGSKSTIQLPFSIKDRKQLPKKIEASVRWDPIDVSVVPSDPANEVAGVSGNATAGVSGNATAGVSGNATAGAAAGSAAAAPAAGTAGSTAAPSTSDTPTASADPSPSPVTPAVGATAGDPGDDTAPAATAAPPSGTVSAPRGKLWIDAPTDVNDLVVPEQLGDVVAPAAAKVGKKTIDVPVTLPAKPGRYRLTVTLHDADGVAYDAATQAMLPAQIVRITGDYDGSIAVVPAASLTAGTEAALGVRVKNLGTAAWGHGVIKTPSDQVKQVPAAAATVVARWVPLSSSAALDADPASQFASADLPIGLAPGKTSDAWLYLTTPQAAGDYLLVLDVVDPQAGSLVASGAQPTLVRVSVTPAR